MTLTVSKITSGIITPDNQYAGDPHCMELLQFFNKHPHTRFSCLALVHALNNGKLCVIDRALKRLVKDGLVILQSDKIVALYSLRVKKSNNE
jgi:hypothetical protein